MQLRRPRCGSKMSNANARALSPAGYVPCTSVCKIEFIVPPIDENLIRIQNIDRRFSIWAAFETADSSLPAKGVGLCNQMLSSHVFRLFVKQSVKLLYCRIT